MKQGRLQFRHYEGVFESREKAYKYLTDIVNSAYSEENRLDESLMAEPIVVVYRDANDNKQAIVCIGVEGEKGVGTLAPYHIVDSAKIEEDIAEMSGSTGDIEQALRDEIARATAKENELQDELDATQTGAGLETDGSYEPETTATYVSNATSLKDADTKLDTELARVEQARKDVTGQDTDVYVPNQSMTSRPIAYIESATSLNDADVKLDEALQALDGETVKNVVVDGVTGVVTNNIAVVSISANTIPIGPYEEYTGRANTPHPIHDEYSVLEAVKQVDTNFIDFRDNINDRLDDEIDRATAAENSISGTVNTFSAATVAFSGATVAEVARLDGRIDNTNTNLSDLSATTATFSANTVGEVARLDTKIEAETSRAEAAENSISGDVTSLSSTTASFSAATVNEIARIDATATRNKVKSTGHTVVVAEAAEGTNLEVNIDGKTLLSDNGELKTGLKIAPLTPGELEANVREAFRLVDNEGTPVDNTVVKIYKSSSLVSVELVTVGGVDYVRITYIDNTGQTKYMDLNIQQLIFEAEFKDGLTVNASHEVKVKIDPTSETFLTVSSEGVKLDGVQNAIDAAVAVETARAENAEDVLADMISDLSGTTEAFSAGTVAKFNLMENTWNVPGSIKHTIDDLLVMSVASGTVEEARFSLLRYYNNGAEHKYYASSNAEHMYYNGQVLARVLDNMGGEASQLSGATVAFSAATVAEIARLDASDTSISGDVNTLSAATKAEITRATTTEEGIQAELDATQLGAGLNSDGTYNPHDTAGDMGNYIATATSLDNADFLLDAALKAESDRAIAAEQALNDAITGSSSDVSSLSGVVETFSSATVNEISRLDSRIDADRTGAGLNTDGTYHKHNTAGDMGNYISLAQSLDEATVMLDSALKTEETRATNAENSISGAVYTLSGVTANAIDDLQNQLDEANSKISTLTSDLRTLSGVVETMQNEMATTIYNTVKAILQGTTKEIKITSNDADKKLTVGFADDAVFGPISLGGNS